MFFYPLYERELGISKLPHLLRGVGGIFFVVSNECEKSTLSVHIILSMSAVILSEMEWNEGYKFTTHYILRHFVPQNDIKLIISNECEKSTLSGNGFLSRSTPSKWHLPRHFDSKRSEWGEIHIQHIYHPEQDPSNKPKILAERECFRKTGKDMMTQYFFSHKKTPRSKNDLDVDGLFFHKFLCECPVLRYKADEVDSRI